MAQAGYFAGLERAIFWLNNVDGYAAGTLGTSIANGNTSGAYVLSDVTAAGLAFAQAQTVQVTGGDREVAQFQFGNPKLNQFSITGTLLDPALVAAISNSAVDESHNSEWTIFGANTYKASPINIGLMLQQRFQPKTTGAASAEVYRNFIIPRATAVIQPGSFGYRAVGSITITVTPSFSTAMHDGRLFNDMAVNFDDDRIDHVEFITDYPLHVMTLRGNASATTINCTYKPMSTVVTVNATKNHLALNGTPTALSSIVISTGVATLSAAPAAGVMAVLTYETQFKLP